jgi:excalibur calcium-binding domain-containing protein
MPPPGAYPDPTGGPGEWYWDGKTWRGEIRPQLPDTAQLASRQAASVPPNKPKLWDWKIVGGAIGGLLLMAMCTNAISDNADRSKTPVASPSTTATAPPPTPP